MAKRYKWTRESALDYLAHSSAYQAQKSNKPLNSTAEIKRKASYYKRAEEAGVTPSVAGSRGHAKPQHIPRQGRVREQYRIGSKERKVTKKDIELLRKEAAKGTRTKKGETPEQYTARTGKAYKSKITSHEVTTDRGERISYVTGNVSGHTCADAEFVSDAPPDSDATLSFHIPESHLNALMAQSKDVVEIANNLMAASGLPPVWCEIYSINIT